MGVSDIFAGYQAKPNPDAARLEIMRVAGITMVDEIMLAMYSWCGGMEKTFREMLEGSDPQRLFGGRRVAFFGCTYQISPVLSLHDVGERTLINREIVYRHSAHRWLRENGRVICIGVLGALLGVVAGVFVVQSDVSGGRRGYLDVLCNGTDYSQPITQPYL